MTKWKLIWRAEAELPRALRLKRGIRPSSPSPIKHSMYPPWWVTEAHGLCDVRGLLEMTWPGEEAELLVHPSGFFNKTSPGEHGDWDCGFPIGQGSNLLVYNLILSFGLSGQGEVIIKLPNVWKWVYEEIKTKKQTKFPWQEEFTSSDLQTHVEIPDNGRYPAYLPNGRNYTWKIRNNHLPDSCNKINLYIFEKMKKELLIQLKQ